nr:hypothetical protein [Tanacetum cinerariifolium]
RGQRLEQQLAAGGPAQRGGKQRFALRDVANILSPKRLALALIEALGAEGSGGLLGRAFAKYFPGAGAVDALAIGLHPGADALHDGALLVVDGAIAAHGHAHEQVAVFAHHVHEGVDNGFGAFVAVAVVDAAVVVPLAQAGIGLPGQGLNLVALAALDVPHQAFALLGRQDFAQNHGLVAPAVALGAGVVHVRRNAQAGIVHGPQRQGGIVEIHHVGLVLVEQLDGAVVEFLAVFLARRRHAVAPVPLPVYHAVVLAVF